MIFITVGSQKFQFDRLLKKVDLLIDQKKISEKVFAQSGACNYIPQNYEYKPFLDREEFKSIMNQSDIVITHGGTGAIIGAIKAGKKVIAIPRLKKYEEHVDDHQIQLVEEFTTSNLICGCFQLENLEDCINEVRIKNFSIYHSNTKKYLDSIIKFIERY